MEPRPFERPPVSHLPLVVAAAALVLVAWIAADRFRPGDKRVGPRILYAEPRVSLRASY